MSTIDREDLREVRDLIMERLEGGFTDLNDRLDALNGRTRQAERDIAVLQDRTTEARNAGAKWGAGVGGIMAALSWLSQWMGSSR